MNASDLTGCRASFTDLSGIMKNLRNAFIYTASTQQRNGNFQQWLPYNALCLGQATPSHCILETMRPRAWAASSSHRGLGRSLPPRSIPLVQGHSPCASRAVWDPRGPRGPVARCGVSPQYTAHCVRGLCTDPGPLPSARGGWRWRGRDPGWGNAGDTGMDAPDCRVCCWLHKVGSTRGFSDLCDIATFPKCREKSINK